MSIEQSIYEFIYCIVVEAAELYTLFYIYAGTKYSRVLSQLIFIQSFINTYSKNFP